MSSEVTFLLVLKVIIQSMIVLAAFVGNSLVIVAIVIDRTGRLRVRGNTFYGSLAVADLLLTGLVMIPALIIEAQEHRVWPFPIILCRPYLAVEVLCCCASILNLLSIAVDRYIHVEYPMSYYRIINLKMLIFIIVGIWFLSSLISLLPIFLGWHRTEVPLNLTNSTEITRKITLHSHKHLEDRNVSDVNLDSSDFKALSVDQLVNTHIVCEFKLNAVYAFISSLMSFFLPCTLMTAIYCLLFNIALKHRRRRLSNEKIAQRQNIHYNCIQKFQQETEQPNNININRNTTDSRLRKKKSGSVIEHKAALTLGIIMGCFLVCWTPYFVANCVKPLCETDCISIEIMTSLVWMGYLNSCLNPIIYSLFNLEFRRAFYEIVFQKIFRVKKNKFDAYFSVRSRSMSRRKINNNSSIGIRTGSVENTNLESC